MSRQLEDAIPEFTPQWVCLQCGYVFLEQGKLRFNPYGPAEETAARSARIGDVVRGRALKTVCGYNYVTDFAGWMKEFERLLPDTTQ